MDTPVFWTINQARDGLIDEAAAPFGLSAASDGASAAKRRYEFGGGTTCTTLQIWEPGSQTPVSLSSASGGSRSHHG